MTEENVVLAFFSSSLRLNRVENEQWQQQQQQPNYQHSTTTGAKTLAKAVHMAETPRRSVDVWKRCMCVCVHSLQPTRSSWITITGHVGSWRHWVEANTPTPTGLYIKNPVMVSSFWPILHRKKPLRLAQWELRTLYNRKVPGQFVRDADTHRGDYWFGVTYHTVNGTFSIHI